jgi:cytochrome c6
MKTTTTLMLFTGLSLGTACTLSAAPASENWENHCASCHGEDGKAQTKQGKKLKLRDYTDAAVQAEMKDDTMLKAILDGVKENGKERMKGFREEISEDEAKELVAYVRKLKV